MSNLHRVAIYGGSFDPPHLGHVFTVHYLLTRSDLDEVWIVPTAQHAFAKDLTLFAQRVQLLKRLFNDISRVKVCEIEAEGALSGYTFDTLEYLSSRYPSHSFVLVIGADNIVCSDRWHRFDDLLERWPLIVIGRQGFETDLSRFPPTSRIQLGPSLLSISSAEIRDALSSSPKDVHSWSQYPLSLVPHVLKEQLIDIYQARRASEIITSDLVNSPTLREPRVCKIWIWGAGRCGRALYQAIKHEAGEVHIQSLREWGRLIQSDLAKDKDIFSSTLRTAIEDYPMWLLACRDDQLPDWIRDLCHHLQSVPFVEGDQERSVFHCSGVLTHDILSPFVQYNFSLGRMHPLLSLRGDERDVTIVKSASFLVTGMPLAVRLGGQLVHRIGAHLLDPPKEPPSFSEAERTEVYHAAASLGANLSTIPLLLSELMFAQLGYSPDVIKRALSPLFQSALRAHLFPQPESRDLKQSWRAHLTGPLVRNDEITIQKHLEVIQQLAVTDPALSRSLHDVYRLLMSIGSELINQSTPHEHLNDDILLAIESS